MNVVGIKSGPYLYTGGRCTSHAPPWLDYERESCNGLSPIMLLFALLYIAPDGFCLSPMRDEPSVDIISDKVHQPHSERACAMLGWQL
jgi:hypothetical protein